MARLKTVAEILPELSDAEVERYMAFADWHLGYWIGCGAVVAWQAFMAEEWTRHAGPLDEIDRDFYVEGCGA